MSIGQIERLQLKHDILTERMLKIHVLTALVKADNTSSLWYLMMKKLQLLGLNHVQQYIQFPKNNLKKKKFLCHCTIDLGEGGSAFETSFLEER